MNARITALVCVLTPSQIKMIEACSWRCAAVIRVA
jgi:hypothetical protein